MPPAKPPPLPLAPDRAALSNRISLLLAGRSSLLQTLNPNRNSPTTKRTATTNHNDRDNDDDLFKGTRANEGVGYVSSKPTTDTSRENKILRGKLLGKRKVGGASTARKTAVASDSEEDEGRSGLGKRKRPRKTPAAEEDAVPDVVGETPGQGSEMEVDAADARKEETGDDGNTMDVKPTDTTNPDDESTGANADAAEATEGSKKKRRKRKNRNKKKPETAAV